MQRRYDYIRPFGKLPGRRKRNSFIYLILLLGLIGLFYFLYLDLKVNPKKKEIKLNQTIASLCLESENSLQTLLAFTYQGPKAESQRQKALKKSSELIKRAGKLLADNKTTGKIQLQVLLDILSLNAGIKTVAQLSFNEQVLKESLPVLIKDYARLKNLVLKLKLEEPERKKLLSSQPVFEVAKIFHPQETLQVLKKRRGLGLISFTTNPRLKRTDKEGVYELPFTEYFDLHLEIQNQGEIIEKNVILSLSLESTSLAEPFNLEETVDVIKPGERKPVSFTRIPLEASPGNFYTLKVLLKPVPGERVLENNELKIDFYLIP